MNNSKPWYQSRTIIGILVAFLAGIASMLQLFGIDLGLDSAAIEQFIVALFLVVGTILGIVGRVKAEKTIQAPEPK